MWHDVVLCGVRYISVSRRAIFCGVCLISLCCFVSVWWGFVTFRCAAFFFVLVPVRRVKLRS